ncbi:MAG: YceD family protein [Gammaproteobacteria bacterium]
MPGQSEYIVGNIALLKLLKLQDLVFNPTDELSVKLNLGRDDEGIPYLRGQIQGEIEVSCQRCLERLKLNIASQFSLSPVAEDHLVLPAQYDPIIAEEGQIQLIDLVSEEILLSMPMIASHPEDACPGTQWLKTHQQKVNEETHPFHILKQLK